MEKSMHMDDLIAKTEACMLAHGMCFRTVYGNYTGAMRVIQHYCHRHGRNEYDQELVARFIAEALARKDAGEISRSYYMFLRKVAERMDEVYRTGSLTWNVPRKKARFRLTESNGTLLDEFLSSRYFHSNTKNDFSWVIRRYPGYLHDQGIQDIAQVKSSDLAAFIIRCSKELSRGSVRNIVCYTRQFHDFLRDSKKLDIPYEGILSISVAREERIQQPLTTDELNRIIAHIDLDSGKGKRHYAIIRLGAELGLRASDIINLRLRGLNWLKNEAHVLQRKTRRYVNLPLTPQVSGALREYILNGRPDTDLDYVFLTLTPPFRKIKDACAIGDIIDEHRVAGPGNRRAEICGI